MAASSNQPKHSPLRDEGEHDRLRALVQSSPMGMHFYRLEADDRLVFVGANPAADRLLGVENSRFLGKTIEEAFPPLAATEIPARYREVARAGIPWSTEQIDYRDDQIVGAFEVHAFQTGPGEMVATFLEIAARKRTEEALRRSEEKYRLLVEAQNDLVVKVDLEGRFLFVSESYCRVFGKSEAELLGRAFMPLVHEEDRAATARAMEDLFRPPWSCYLEQRALTAMGWRRFAWSDRALRNERGEVVAIVGTGRDVTEQREMEDRLRQAEKLQAIGQIAGGVAHDFNNQLTGILGNATLLAEALAGSPELKSAAEDIREAAGRSARLTAQLLAFARKGALQSVPVDVHRVVREVMGLLRRSIDKRIVLREELTATLPHVIGDPVQLHNALLNLALNARDAMPDGGELRITTRTVDLSPARCATLQLEGDGPWLEVGVTDTGCGMEEELQARIFEPFFTTKAVGHGSGLGLSAVYGTVKTHRGALDLRSAPGAGSSFTLWFPAIQPELPGNAPSPASAPAGRRARVLVVDDEPVVRTSLERILRRLGHEVVTAKLGREALARFDEDPGAIDVVILDMMMPDLPGKDVYERLLARAPEARVILSSGNALDHVEAEILRGRPGWTLQKPYSTADVAAALEAALAGRQA